MSFLGWLAGSTPQGVMAEVAGKATEGLIGGLGDAAIKIRQAIKGKELDPAIAAELEKVAIEADQAVLNGQLAIDLEEAKSERLFKSGWRPALGWICDAAIGYTYVLQPFLSFIVQVTVWLHSTAGTPFPSFPTLSIQDILGLVGLLLGGAVLRSADKRAGLS